MLRGAGRQSRISVALAALACLLVAPAWAQKTDVVTLVNGDTFTCEIKLLERGRLEASTDHLGTVDIEWDKVASVKATRLFRVETASGLRLLGQLATPRPGELDVVQETGAVTVDHLTVVSIVPIGARFWNRIDGSIDLGFSYTQSSGIAQMDLNATAVYRQTRSQVSVAGSSYLTRQEDAEGTSRHSLEIKVARTFRENSLWLVQGGFMRNEELGYTLRSTVSSGIGRFFYRSNRGSFVLGGGLSTSQELPVDGDTPAQESVDGLVVVQQSFYTYDYPKTEVSTAYTVYPGFSQWGRIRMELDAKVKREVLPDFTIGLTIYDSYDNRPPTAEARKNDLGVSLTIGWTF